jgi:hypothetical protein
MARHPPGTGNGLFLRYLDAHNEFMGLLEGRQKSWKGKYFAHAESSLVARRTRIYLRGLDQT